MLTCHVTKKLQSEACCCNCITSCPVAVTSLPLFVGGPGMQTGMMQAGQGMVGGMYNPQAMAHLPQLAQPQMGLNMMGYGQPMGPQQAYGNANPAQGMTATSLPAW